MVQERESQFGLDQLDLLSDLGVSTVKATKQKYCPRIPLEDASAFKGDKRNFPNTLLIVDTETTGLDPESDRCLEVGVVLFYVPKRTVLAQHSFLLPVSSNQAERINHISADVTRIKQPWQEALLYFKALVESSDLLVAHNVAFDKQWFGKAPLPQLDKPWICTMEDIIWPSDRNLRSTPSVRDLALAYEIPVWSAHRALTDCIYLAEVFRRCNDLENLLTQGLEPKRLMRADISYEQRHLARQAGFRWNDPIKGAWTRRMSERQASILEFPVVFVEKTS